MQCTALPVSFHSRPVAVTTPPASEHFADGDEVRVEMTDFAFDPGEFSVERGARVTFVFENTAAIPHETLVGDEERGGRPRSIGWSTPTSSSCRVIRNRIRNDPEAHVRGVVVSNTCQTNRATPGVISWKQVRPSRSQLVVGSAITTFASPVRTSGSGSQPKVVSPPPPPSKAILPSRHVLEDEVTGPDLGRARPLPSEPFLDRWW